MTPSYQSRPKTLSDLFQGTLSLEPSIRLKERLRPSPLLKLKVCFSRQVNVVPPQVTVLYVAVHLNLRSVVTTMTPEKTLTKANTAKTATTVTTTTNVTTVTKVRTVTTVKSEPPVATATTVTTAHTVNAVNIR